MLGAWVRDPGETRAVGVELLERRTYGLTAELGSDGSVAYRPNGDVVGTELVRSYRTEWRANMHTRPVAQLTRSRETGRARLLGTHACGSVHECPVCRMRIVQRRQLEIAHALETWRARGGEVLFVTLTVRHSAYDDDAVIRAVPRVLSSMRKGRTYRDWWKRLELGTVERDAHGRVERVRCQYVRALEVTHGRNGWHPHVHALVFVERLPPTTRARVRALMELKRHWADEVERTMGRSHRPSMRHGVDVQVADGRVGDYLAKLGLELTHDLAKTDRTAGESPMALLERATRGERDAVELWRRYARAVLGLRQLTWSLGTRRALGMPGGEQGPEDADLARERPDDDDEVVLELPTRLYTRHLAHRTELMCWVLEGIARCDSREHARRWAWETIRSWLVDEYTDRGDALRGALIARELAMAEGEARSARRRELERARHVERTRALGAPREHEDWWFLHVRRALSAERMGV